MSHRADPDELIREALRAEGLDSLEMSAEPGPVEMVTEIFRGRMWWTGVIMMSNLLACTVLAVVCGWQLLTTAEVIPAIRWGAGFFGCVVLAVGCKLWYWMRLQQLVLTREIKRVELLVAHLAQELRERA